MPYEGIVIQQKNIITLAVLKKILTFTPPHRVESQIRSKHPTLKTLALPGFGYVR